MITLTLHLLLLLKIVSCQNDKINDFYEKINIDKLKFNAMAAEIAWESSINPNNQNLPSRAADYQRELIQWQHRTCDQLFKLQHGHLINSTQQRQTYLLCRGIRFTFDEARETSALYEELQSIYSDAKLCIPNEEIINKNNIELVENEISKYLKISEKYTESSISRSKDEFVRNEDFGFCLNGESEFDKIMSFSKNEKILKWLWLTWRQKVGPPMKEPYRKLVSIENIAARRNGYTDIGEVWRDELEIPNLREKCHQLYNNMKPLYVLLHGVVRFFLRKKYGSTVPRTGPLPAHLLGNLWAQNWEPLINLIVNEDLSFDKNIEKLNWTVLHMVKRSEDYYLSMGLPAMTKLFWRNSVFSRKSDATRCHGTAADMFRSEDYRLLYCSGTSFDDFYVLHHEMGHIQYYMAYANQPAIFRDGANTAFHESIGDAIMYGVSSPQHLHRLGIINDSLLYTYDIIYKNLSLQDYKNYNPITSVDENYIESDENKFDDEADDKIYISTGELLLLKQGLNKIPQIPFSLLIDEYRWKYFEGTLGEHVLNKEFWRMSLELQGIAPPEERGEENFDIGAKFHVPDNTPYIRYFLSSFLQHQIFESLCKSAVFGRHDNSAAFPDTFQMHKCDIYGSKAAGKLLKDIMSRGSSQHWREILWATTGYSDITSAALERYYRPLHKFLTGLVRKYRIPTGW